MRPITPDPNASTGGSGAECADGTEKATHVPVSGRRPTVAPPHDSCDAAPLELRSTPAAGAEQSRTAEELAKLLKKIDSFVPKIDPRDWARIESFVRDAVRDSDPDRYSTAQTWLSSATELVNWSVKVESLPLDRQEVFYPQNIFDFVAQRKARTDAANGSVRSILLRMSARLIGEHKGASEDRRSYNGSVGKKPYTTSEKIGLRSFIDGQRTPHRRDALEVIVSLGAGAGLSSVDMLKLTASDIERRGEALIVHVPGPKARQVPVLDQWDDLVETALRKAPLQGPLLLPTYVNYRTGNAVADFLWGCNGEGVRPQSQRLRSTWIVDHLNAATPLNLLLKTAGVAKPTAFDRYLPYTADLAIDDHVGLLRLERGHE